MPKRLIIFLFLSLSGCGQNQSIEQVSGKTMGTTYLIKSQGVQASQQQVDVRLNQINKIFSSWDKSSEISQLNRQPINHSIAISAELSQVLNAAIQVHQQTDGYFDPGLGQLIDVWGFGAISVLTKPDRKAIATALNNSSIVQTTLEGQKFSKKADVYLNLSAIAKGYAVDEIYKLLDQQGIERFMVEIGGEIKAKGSWTIGIETPAGQDPIEIKLINKSIATSGNYRQYFVWEGERYAHILDPHTGLPVNSDLFSASVIHPSNLLADAYATAMMSMGSKKAIELAQRLQLKTVLILEKCDNPCLSKNVVKIGL
ncbi:MAG: FAD:protein FMN transferase [Candidatus Thioglobus sp.]